MEDIIYTAQDLDAALASAMGHEKAALLDWHRSGVMAEWRCTHKLDTAKAIADRTTVSQGTVSKCRTIARKWSSADAMIKALDKANLYHTIENAYEVAKGTKTSEVKFSAAKVAGSLEKKYTKAQLRKIVAELNTFLEG
jgi:hypothetical protein